MDIRGTISGIAKQFNTTKPAYIIEQLETVELIEYSLPTTTLGMTIHSEGQNTILVSNKISEELSEFVTAHELGHVYLHSGIASTTFMRQYTSGVQISKGEAEANEFAFDLLLHDRKKNKIEFNKFDFVRSLNLNENMARFILD